MKNMRRGITLVEIIVATFVMSILLLVAVQVLIPALRAWSDGQKRSEVSQSLLVTANWIGDDVLRSSPNSLLVNDEGVLVMRCTAQNPADDSNEFTEMVAYWLEGDELFRGTRSASAGESEPPITIAELGGFNTKRRIASGVVDFKPVVERAWLIDLTLKLDKNGRPGELKTSYASIYAPLDPNIAALEEDS